MGVNDLMAGLSADDLSPESSIRSTLLQRIRVGIVSGKTPPGEILTVPSLAKPGACRRRRSAKRCSS